MAHFWRGSGPLPGSDRERLNRNLAFCAESAPSRRTEQGDEHASTGRRYAAVGLPAGLSGNAGVGRTAAQAASAEEETGSLDLAAQIAKWRKTAGFSGQYSEVSTHNKGCINWFIDLVPDGRITLHGHKRTVFTTLHGATITALPKAIEVGVRDEYWSDGDPLMVFQVLEGSPPNERRQWQEWLEAARNRADVSARKGY